MAFQPETITYETGVYQLETTDPVQGGVGGKSNEPLLHLANRTAWLKKWLDDVLAGTVVPTGLATLASPAFTGTPTAPTPPLGDNSTKIATTAFVQGTVNGLLSKSVAGNSNVTLTAVEAGNGILVFTGVLTGSINVIVPAVAKTWVVVNNTTGAFTLTLKTAAGSGIAITQGRSTELWYDGTNVLVNRTDFVDLALTGVPTAPTPTGGDNSTKIATTAFVTAAVAALQGNAVLKDSSTGAAQLPVGSVAQRPASGQGKLRYNSDSNRFEGNNGSAWGSLGGATGGGTDAVFYLNDQTVNNDYTIPAGQNAMSAGPITIADGKTVTVPDGSSWTVV